VGLEGLAARDGTAQPPVAGEPARDRADERRIALRAQRSLARRSLLAGHGEREHRDGPAAAAQLADHVQHADATAAHRR
jgi:hypothetical protein